MTTTSKPAYRGDWQSDGSLDLIKNSDDSTLLDDISTAIGGIAAGYRLARGTAIATESVAVVTGLTTITGYAVSPVADTATKSDAAVAISAKPQAGTPGTLGIFRWKATGPSTNTVIAATTAGTVSWLAVGT